MVNYCAIVVGTVVRVKWRYAGGADPEIPTLVSLFEVERFKRRQHTVGEARFYVRNHSRPPGKVPYSCASNLTHRSTGRVSGRNRLKTPERHSVKEPVLHSDAKTKSGATPPPLPLTYKGRGVRRSATCTS